MAKPASAGLLIDSPDDDPRAARRPVFHPRTRLSTPGRRPSDGARPGNGEHGRTHFMFRTEQEIVPHRIHASTRFMFRTEHGIVHHRIVAFFKLKYFLTARSLRRR